MESKKWYQSKVLWVNFLAIVGEVFLHITGHALPAGWDASILAVINFFLRFITKKELS